MSPFLREAEKVDTGSHGPIQPGPPEQSCVWVDLSPDIHRYNVLEQGTQDRGALTPCRCQVGTPTIYTTVPYCIKITTDDGGDQSVDLSTDILEKTIPFWVSIWGVDSHQAKVSCSPSKFS